MASSSQASRMRKPRRGAERSAKEAPVRPSPPTPLPILGEGCLARRSLPGFGLVAARLVSKGILEVLVTIGTPLPGLGEGSGVRAVQVTRLTDRSAPLRGFRIL